MRERTLSVEEIIKLGKDISQALILCERKNIIHRDIKPANIMVSDLGNYKLGDFGVSKVMDHTTFATATGTEEYQAPEVVHMEEYGHTADIYSLGITLYWLLNNRKMPFIRANEQLLTTTKNAEAKERRYRGEKLPAPKNGTEKLKKIVLKACEYRPKDRYASAQELYDDLASLRSGKTKNENTSNSANVKQKKSSKKQDNEWKESKTNGKSIAKYEGNIEEQTDGNSWGGTSVTIGKPGKLNPPKPKQNIEAEEIPTDTIDVKKAYERQEKKQQKKEKTSIEPTVPVNTKKKSSARLDVIVLIIIFVGVGWLYYTNRTQKEYYDSKKTKIKTVTEYGFGKIDQQTTFNEDGEILKDTSYRSNGKIDVCDEYEYNEEGNEIKWKETRYGSDGEIVWCTEYEYKYNENGDKIKYKETRYNMLTLPGEKEGGYTVTYYDENGNETESKNYDADGNEIN